MNIFLDFVRLLKKVTKQLASHITPKTSKLQDTVFTFLRDDIFVTFNNSYLYIAIFVPSAETQGIFNESIRNYFTFSFSSWKPDIKAANKDLENQVDAGWAQNNNSPKSSILAHKTQTRTKLQAKEVKL